MLTGKNRSEPVVAVRIEPFDACDFRDFSARSPSFKEHENIDSLGNETAGYGDSGFLHQLFDAIQRTPGGIGMHRGKSTGMTRVPGLQHVERFSTPYLTDDDTIRSQTKG